jgi:hypothetical protein
MNKKIIIDELNFLMYNSIEHICLKLNPILQNQKILCLIVAQTLCYTLLLFIIILIISEIKSYFHTNVVIIPYFIET